MTDDAVRQLNKNYGDSPVWRGSVPITSSLFESCSRVPTLAAMERLASSTRGTASRLPFGSKVESWPPQPSACPRPSPHAVPRVDGASRELRFLCLVGVARKKLFEHIAERCARVQLREDSQPAQPHAMDQQVARGQVQLHGHSA
jgi:hypothetical protein